MLILPYGAGTLVSISEANVIVVQRVTTARMRVTTLWMTQTAILLARCYWSSLRVREQLGEARVDSFRRIVRLASSTAVQTQMSEPVA